MTPYSSRVASKESTVNFTSAVPHIYTHRKGFFHSHAKKEREIIWSCPVPRFCWKVGRSVWLLDNEFKGDINCFQEARFFLYTSESNIQSNCCFVLFCLLFPPRGKYVMTRLMMKAKPVKLLIIWDCYLFHSIYSQHIEFGRQIAREFNVHPVLWLDMSLGISRDDYLYGWLPFFSCVLVLRAECVWNFNMRPEEILVICSFLAYIYHLCILFRCWDFGLWVNLETVEFCYLNRERKQMETCLLSI